MASADQGPSEDEIDYGTGEGAGYGGRDPDAPLFLAHGNDGRHPQHDSNDREQTRNSYSHYVSKAWRAIKSVFSWTFSRTAGWNAIASVVIAIATVFYTIYAKRQWKAVSDQIEVMRKTNDLTTTALNGSEESMKTYLDKMQHQVDASNNLFEEAKHQTGALLKQAAESHASAVSLASQVSTSQTQLQFQATQLGARFEPQIAIRKYDDSDSVQVIMYLCNIGKIPPQEPSYAFAGSFTAHNRAGRTFKTLALYGKSSDLVPDKCLPSASESSLFRIDRRAERFYGWGELRYRTLGVPISVPFCRSARVSDLEDSNKAEIKYQNNPNFRDYNGQTCPD